VTPPPSPHLEHASETHKDVSEASKRLFQTYEKSQKEFALITETLDKKKKPPSKHKLAPPKGQETILSHYSKKK
jgi:hypothetical protein